MFSNCFFAFVFYCMFFFQIKNDMGDVYLTLRLDLIDNSGETDFSLSTLTNNILLALKNNFGEVGAAIPLKVIAFDSDSRNIKVLTNQVFLKKIRCALTLQDRYQGVQCCFSTQGIQDISE